MKSRLDSEQKRVVKALARQFSSRYESLNVLSVSRSIVCEINTGSASFILKSRAANTPHGKTIAIEAEWMAYLHENGIGVPRLVRSTSGQFVAQEDSGDVALAGYCYEKVPVDYNNRDYWFDPGFIQELGYTVGRMHTLAESCELSEPENVPSWDSAEWITNPENTIHHSFYSDVDLSRTRGDNLFQFVYQNISENRPFLDIDFTGLV